MFFLILQKVILVDYNTVEGLLNIQCKINFSISHNIQKFKGNMVGISDRNRHRYLSSSWALASLIKGLLMTLTNDTNFTMINDTYLYKV